MRSGHGRFLLPPPGLVQPLQECFHRSGVSPGIQLLDSKRRPDEGAGCGSRVPKATAAALSHEAQAAFLLAASALRGSAGRATEAPRLELRCDDTPSRNVNAERSSVRR